MSNQEYRVFHLRGYLSLLVIPNTRIFHFLFLLCYHETHFGHCPILSSLPFNTKHSVNLPCTPDIPSNTKHSVDLPTMHSHPINVICPCIYNAIYMPLHVISCHMHNECYMGNTIHTTYRCHGQSHHLHMTSINHFIHVNLSCKHISTFTFNMSFNDQEVIHTSNPFNSPYT